MCVCVCVFSNHRRHRRHRRHYLVVVVAVAVVYRVCPKRLCPWARPCGTMCMSHPRDSGSSPASPAPAESLNSAAPESAICRRCTSPSFRSRRRGESPLAHTSHCCRRDVCRDTSSNCANTGHGSAFAAAAQSSAHDRMLYLSRPARVPDSARNHRIPKNNKLHTCMEKEEKDRYLAKGAISIEGSKSCVESCDSVDDMVGEDQQPLVRDGVVRPAAKKRPDDGLVTPVVFPLLEGSQFVEKAMHAYVHVVISKHHKVVVEGNSPLLLDRQQKLQIASGHVASEPVAAFNHQNVLVLLHLFSQLLCRRPERSLLDCKRLPILPSFHFDEHINGRDAKRDREGIWQ